MRLVLAFCLAFCSLFGGEQKPRVTLLSSDTIVTGDYFSWGAAVEISGIVQGDVYVLGGQAIIDGRVEGDVLAAGGSVVITGKVEGNIRAVGGQVSIRGSVGKNCTILAGTCELSPSASIGESVVTVAGSADIAAPIGRDLVAIAGSLRISNLVGRDVEAYVDQMRISSKASIGGSVDYTSSSDALVDPAASIGGKIQKHGTVVQHLAPGKWIERFFLGTRVIALLMNFAYSFIIGALLLKLFPDMIGGALTALRQKPAKAFFYGALILILLPLIFLLLLITVLGIPFALMLLGLNIIAFYSAKIVAVLALANKWFKKLGMRQSNLSALALGLALYFLATAIPYVGPVIAIAFLLFGIGASALAIRPPLLKVRR